MTDFSYLQPKLIESFPMMFHSIGLIRVGLMDFYDYQAPLLLESCWCD